MVMVQQFFVFCVTLAESLFVLGAPVTGHGYHVSGPSMEVLGSGCICIVLSYRLYLLSCYFSIEYSLPRIFVGLGNFGIIPIFLFSSFLIYYD